jgi:hypothetical protein
VDTHVCIHRKMAVSTEKMAVSTEKMAVSTGAKMSLNN